MTVPANTIDLTTLAAVKLYAEVSTATDDALIQAAITGFSQYVLARTGRDTLNSAVTYTEVMDGNGSTRLFMRNRPIVAITSVQVNGVLLPASTAYGQGGYFIEQSGRSIGIRQGSSGTFSSPSYPSFSGPIFAKGQGNVQVVYTAGYAPVTVTDELDAIPATPYKITPLQAPWTADVGVKFFIGGAALTRVYVAPAANQYYVSAGVYTFAAADTGKSVLISYLLTGTPFDLEFAVRQACAVNYKRHQTIDLKSKMLNTGAGSGTTSYRDWAIAPEIVAVLDTYKRDAIV